MIATHHHDGRISKLETISLLRGCPIQELVVLAGCTTALSVAATTVLCRQGERGREAFLIEHGLAVATIDGVEIARLGPGSFFGEMALLDGGVRTATVTAVTQLEVLVLNAGEFSLMLTQAPTVVRRMLVGMSGRLRLAERAGTAPTPAPGPPVVGGRQPLVCRWVEADQPVGS